MVKKLGAAIGVLAVAAIALAIIPATRDEIHWRWVSYKDETASYEAYVKAWPAGRHIADALGRYDEHGWADALSANTVKEFERYVQLHGEGKHVAEARDNIESLQWQEAVASNTAQGFEHYIRLHSDGKHFAEALDNIESLDWQEAAAAGTIQGYERYVQLHGEGKHAAEARDNIESLQWKDATVAGTIRSYQKYSLAYPQGRYAQEAQKRASALRTDDAVFIAALKNATEATLKQFLEDFPGHRKEPEARQALKDVTEGRDVVDLLKEKKIEIQAEGGGIQRVSIRLRRLVPYPLTVRIPVGSFFVSSSSSVQNMVTTSESKVRLASDQWHAASPDAACANRPRDIPATGDRFTVRRSPQQKELARLMPALGRARVDTATRQAAVWIVTDNADYSDLGILVASQFGFGGSRVIKELEAAHAMWICDEAGIDITQKAIWKDRRRIISGLKDDRRGLRTWLEKKK